jgi:hypothetical protein
VRTVRRLYKEFESGGDYCIGIVQLYEGQGYRFLPQVSGRRGSVKVWPSADSCIPRWAKKMADREDIVQPES